MTEAPSPKTRPKPPGFVVVVSGLPRSGTSMAMAMLAAGGLDCVSDGTRTADEDNPKGYFEDERVKKLRTSSAWVRESLGRGIKVVSPLLGELPADLRYKVLFMLRDLDEVLASQARMMERRGEANPVSDEQMRTTFEGHLERVRRTIAERPEMEVLYLEHRRVLEDPIGQARAMAAFLELPLEVERMAAAVDRRLYRNRSG